MITADEVTKARELLGWSIVDLAGRSGLDRMDILTFELGSRRLEERDIERIRAAPGWPLMNSSRGSSSRGNPKITSKRRRAPSLDPIFDAY